MGFIDQLAKVAESSTLKTDTGESGNHSIDSNKFVSQGKLHTASNPGELEGLTEVEKVLEIEKPRVFNRKEAKQSKIMAEQSRAAKSTTIQTYRNLKEVSENAKDIVVAHYDFAGQRADDIAQEDRGKSKYGEKLHRTRVINASSHARVEEAKLEADARVQGVEDGLIIF